MAALDTTPALVLIDLQRGIVARPTVHPVEEVVARAAALAAGFRRLGHAVVLVNVAGVAPGRTEASQLPADLPAGWSDLVDDLGAQPGDLRVTKLRWGALQTTDLDGELRRRDVTQVVLAGINTSVGVESTARSAHELGYNVLLVTDAMTDGDADAHRNSVDRIFPRLGERILTAELLALLGA